MRNSSCRKCLLVALFPVMLGWACFDGIAASKPLARPTPEQAAWQDMELEMFIHFGPATWEDVQHSNLTAPPSALNPEKLDTEQWADVAVSMGAGQIIFVAKHDGGFCWWQTETTDYSVKSTPWRGGKGDVMKDLSESCRKRGLKFGVYLSPADRKLGVAVGGRAKTPEEQERYNGIYRQQLTELLSRYGEISEVWFDGSLIVPVGDILQKYAPRAMVFQGSHATILWVGNEEGMAPYPAWNSITAEKAKSGVATAFDGDPDGDVWLPSECDARIRTDWFWSTKNASTLKTVEQLMRMYYGSIGHGSVLLLNHTPDTTGLIPEADVKRAAEFGAEIRRRFGKSLAETAGKGNVVELDLGKQTMIDHVITQENILEGERVREYVVEGLVGAEWKKLCEGTAVGHKKIDRFAPVEISKVRLNSVRSAAEPQIRKLAVYSVWGGKMPSESVAELSAATRTLWQWSAENVKQEWSTAGIDLTSFCKDAGVYVVEFARTGGKDLDVQAVNLVSKGRKLDKFVVKRSVRGVTQYHITITEESVSYELQIVSRILDAVSRGQATIYRRIK